MSCCKRSSGVSTRLLEQIRDKLGSVGLYYPGTDVSCIINSAGEIVYDMSTHSSTNTNFVSIHHRLGLNACLTNRAQNEWSKLEDDELRLVVASLKRAALQFGLCFVCTCVYSLVLFSIVADPDM
jgi:hypothetical protein